MIRYPSENWVLYDLEAQCHISWQDLLLRGWQEEVALLSSIDDTPVENPDYNALTLNSMYAVSTEGVVRCYFEEDCYLKIPWYFLRFE